MEDVRGVHGLQRTQSLVNKVLAVVIRQVLRADNAVHICFHQFLQYQSISRLSGVRRTSAIYLNEVDFVETLIVSRPLDVQNGDDILMVEVAEQLHLS